MLNIILPKKKGVSHWWCLACELKKLNRTDFFVRAFLCLQRAFQNPSILVSALKHSLRGRDTLNSFWACSRAKNKNLKTKKAILVYSY